MLSLSFTFIVLLLLLLCVWLTAVKGSGEMRCTDWTDMTALLINYPRRLDDQLRLRLCATVSVCPHSKSKTA